MLRGLLQACKFEPDKEKTYTFGIYKNIEYIQRNIDLHRY